MARREASGLEEKLVRPFKSTAPWTSKVTAKDWSWRDVSSGRPAFLLTDSVLGFQLACWLLTGADSSSRLLSLDSSTWKSSWSSSNSSGGLISWQANRQQLGAHTTVAILPTNAQEIGELFAGKVLGEHLLARGKIAAMHGHGFDFLLGGDDVPVQFRQLAQSAQHARSVEQVRSVMLHEWTVLQGQCLQVDETHQVVELVHVLDFVRGEVQVLQSVARLSVFVELMLNDEQTGRNQASKYREPRTPMPIRCTIRLCARSKRSSLGSAATSSTFEMALWLNSSVSKLLLRAFAALSTRPRVDVSRL